MSIRISSLSRRKDLRLIFVLVIIAMLTISMSENSIVVVTKLSQRTLPRITEFKMPNSNLKVFIVGGDGMTNSKSRAKNGLQSQGCKIAKLETNGSEMMPFIEHAELDCLKKGKEENWVFIDKEGQLRMRADRKSAVCHLTYFDYKTDYENVEQQPVLLEEGKKMKQDFATVNCNMNSQNWKGLVMSIVKDEEVVKKAKTNANGHKSGVERLSVAMFGFDSMSQQHFRRKMPATIRQLDKMGAVIMNGYNIVGDGTPQAFIPILTGKTELEMPNTRRRFANASTVDEAYPFVWRNFSGAGYATLYGEDAFAVGIFTYRLKGFKNRPTDHYCRPFYREIERNNAKWNAQCFGSEQGHKSWFRYSEEFLREYKDVDRFLLMHQGALSHDSVNLIEVEDVDFASSIDSMEKEGLLDDVVLIVMADHGHRFTKIRDTHQGQLEERLPMFSVRLPPKFRETGFGKKMQANLLTNKDRLTTPFDVYSTFLDILKLPEDVVKEQDKKQRSLSMLRPIPADRNCDEAGVAAHWCTCLNWQNALASEKDRKQTQMIVEGLVAAIDAQLEGVRDLCAKVTLKKIISAEKLTPNDGLLKYNNVKDKDGFVPSFKGKAKMSFAHFKVKVETSPNGAIFEATMYFDALKNELEVDMTSLSHVNKYGDDPHCVIDEVFSLAGFCVCHDRVRN